MNNFRVSVLRTDPCLLNGNISCTQTSTVLGGFLLTLLVLSELTSTTDETGTAGGNETDLLTGRGIATDG